jgi:hypothetical protein
LLSFYVLYRTSPFPRISVIRAFNEKHQNCHHRGTNVIHGTSRDRLSHSNVRFHDIIIVVSSSWVAGRALSPTDGGDTGYMKRPCLTAWPFLLLLCQLCGWWNASTFGLTVSEDRAKLNLRVAFLEGAMVGVPSCQHSFSQIELENLVGRHVAFRSENVVFC